MFYNYVSLMMMECVVEFGCMVMRCLVVLCFENLVVFLCYGWVVIEVGDCEVVMVVYLCVCEFMWFFEV